MAKQFTVDCEVKGKKTPITFYIGEPLDENPFKFQSDFITKRGGVIPANILKSFQQLKSISDKNRVSFEELCVHIINEINSGKVLMEDIKKSSAISDAKKSDKK